MWKPVKKAEPGFVQGYTKTEMMDLFRSKVNANWGSLSIDGSAFDSTQYSELMKVTDNQFFHRMTGHIERFLQD